VRLLDAARSAAQPLGIGHTTGRPPFDPQRGWRHAGGRRGPSEGARLRPQSHGGLRAHGRAGGKPS
jgi:hypothetical protein